MAGKLSRGKFSGANFITVIFPRWSILLEGGGLNFPRGRGIF